MDLINDFRNRPVRMFVDSCSRYDAPTVDVVINFTAWFCASLRCNLPSFLCSDVAEFAKKKNELKQKTSAALQLGREKQAGYATHSNKRKEREFANKFKAIV